MTFSQPANLYGTGNCVQTVNDRKALRTEQYFLCVKQKDSVMKKSSRHDHFTRALFLHDLYCVWYLNSLAKASCGTYLQMISVEVLVLYRIRNICPAAWVIRALKQRVGAKVKEKKDILLAWSTAELHELLVQEKYWVGWCCTGKMVCTLRSDLTQSVYWAVHFPPPSGQRSRLSSSDNSPASS